jgi:hypothetical protein
LFGEIAIRLETENRNAIYPERFSIAIVMAIVISQPGSSCSVVFALEKSARIDPVHTKTMKTGKQCLQPF